MNAWTRLVAGLLDRGAREKAVVVGMALVSAGKLGELERATFVRFSTLAEGEGIAAVNVPAGRVLFDAIKERALRADPDPEMLERFVDGALSVPDALLKGWSAP